MEEKKERGQWQQRAFLLCDCLLGLNGPPSQMAHCIEPGWPITTVDGVFPPAFHACLAHRICPFEYSLHSVHVLLRLPLPLLSDPHPTGNVFNGNSSGDTRANRTLWRFVILSQGV